jgi:hypothetical protein
VDLIVNFCSNCGVAVQPEWKVCPYCEYRLQTSAFSQLKPLKESDHVVQLDLDKEIISQPSFRSSFELEKKKRLSKGQKKAILIVLVIAISGTIAGISIYFGLNMVRTINYYVNNGLTSRSYTYTLPRAEYDSVSRWSHPSHSYYDADLVVQTLESYCTPNSDELQKIGTEVISRCIDQQDDEEIINALLSFTQGITYKSESEDRAQYPLETIFNKGDCEDLCIFFGSLVEAVDYNAILLCVEVWDSEEYEWVGHAMVGVYLSFTPSEHDGMYSWYYGVGGYNYWLCETTYQGWMVGELSVQDSSDLNILSYAFID